MAGLASTGQLMLALSMYVLISSLMIGGSYASCDCDVGDFCNDTDCLPCPACSFCVGGNSSWQECPVGTFVDDTSNSSCIPCPPGFWSGPGATQCTICSEGYYCSASNRTEIRCSYPYYCPEGSAWQWKCPLGTRAVDPVDLILRTSSNVSCRICPAGFYGNHTERLICQSCSPGYFCPRGTGHGDDNPCIAGYYCPRGASLPEPCPAGTEGILLRATRVEDCRLVAAASVVGTVTYVPFFSIMSLLALH